MYIEKIIFLNFIIDYIILKTLSKLLKIQTNNKKLLTSSLIGEITLIYLFEINELVILISKIIIIASMIYTSFGYQDIKNFVKNIIYYFIISFFLGGILHYLKDNNIKYYLLFIPIIMNIYEYFEYNLKDIIKNKYKVSIYLNNGKILYLNGFMDTGNNLIEPYSNRKVIIINEKVDENFYLVPYKTINGDFLIKCFNPKRVYIDGIGDVKNISVGIINKKFDGYNCLLNNKILEEK
ncbi:MAG: sigma-E processing peptidase SpoIIGA [Bacilli bacterium]|nr:sigma-E processing peptidase SpoIIGA [Bacilli bacterium]